MNSWPCWEIGISLWPEHRGKGHGSRAQRMLAEYLFAHTPVERIEAQTASDNLAERRALEKAGFRVSEHPITFVERTAGQSKMHAGIVAEALVRITLWGLGSRGLAR